MLRLADRTFLEAARLARDPRAVVLLPLGAVEQHGPHLPLSVDWLGAEELARRLAPPLRRAGYRPLLAPSLPYGASPLAERWAGTVSLRPATLARAVVEIVESLARHGFRRFVLTNYQADPGHLAALATARRRLGRDRRVRVVIAGFAPGARVPSAMVNPRVTALMRSPHPEREWHSGELETAFVLFARPDLVRRALARRLPPAWVDVRRALAQGARRFEEIAPEGAGYFGWPAVARAATGRRVFTLRSRLIAAEVVQRLGGPPGVQRRRRSGRRRGGVKVAKTDR